jgi:hypothetical protein
MTQSKAFAILIEIDMDSSLQLIVERRNAGPTTKNKMSEFIVE